MYRLRRPLLLLILGLAAALLAAPAPAGARVVERGVIDEQFSFVEPDYCGIPVTGEGTVSGPYTWRTRGNGLQYYSEHLRVGVTVTNEDGDFITTAERTMTKDLHLTDLGGGVLDIIWFGTGNFTMYDSSGKAIARNPGQLRLHTVIQLNDPADPEDDELISEDVILGSTGRSDDFCTAVIGALG